MLLWLVNLGLAGSPATAASVWTEVTDNSDTWTANADNSDAWTVVTDGADSWVEQ